MRPMLTAALTRLMSLNGTSSSGSTDRLKGHPRHHVERFTSLTVIPVRCVILHGGALP